MRAPKVVDFYTAAWPDFTPALTAGTGALISKEKVDLGKPIWK